MDKLSYALGLSMGNNFMRSGIDNLNFSDFAAGVEASYKGDHSQMSLDEAKQTVNRFFAEMENRLQEVNKKAGEQYLAENAKYFCIFCTNNRINFSSTNYYIYIRKKYRYIKNKYNNSKCNVRNTKLYKYR